MNFKLDNEENGTRKSPTKEKSKKIKKQKIHYP